MTLGPPRVSSKCPLISIPQTGPFSGPSTRCFCGLSGELSSFRAFLAEADDFGLKRADDFHLPRNCIACTLMPCRAYFMAPDLLAEWPVISSSMCFVQAVTMWIFDMGPPLLSGKRGVSAVAPFRSLSALIARSNGQSLLHSSRPQHLSVLHVPTPFWSVLDFLTFSLTTLLSSPSRPSP